MGDQKAPQQVLVMEPAEGRAYWLVGDRVTIKLTGAETGGAYSLFDLSVLPGGGPPPHLHHREDEAFYVLEGEFEIWSSEGSRRVGPGSFIFGPRGLPHTFKNVGPERGRLQVITSPSGFEHFVTALGTPSGSADEAPAFPDIPTVIRVAAEHGIEILPPPESEAGE